MYRTDAVLVGDHKTHTHAKSFKILIKYFNDFLTYHSSRQQNKNHQINCIKTQTNRN